MPFALTVCFLGLFLGVVGWVLEMKESINKLITEVETIVKLISSGLLNFSCGGGWWVCGWVVGEDYL